MENFRVGDIVRFKSRNELVMIYGEKDYYGQIVIAFPYGYNEYTESCIGNEYEVRSMSTDGYDIRLRSGDSTWTWRYDAFELVRRGDGNE